MKRRRRCRRRRPAPPHRPPSFETVVGTAFDEKLLAAILAALYASPGRLAILPIQDLFGWKDRINAPGTFDASNWRWRLPFDPAHAADDPKLRARIA
ncbi:MAG: 4-alpha-glucanotransferase [Candidatus Binataceae bacterium]